MPYPLWLKIWLGLLGILAVIGLFPWIVMYFRVNGRPMWELPLWHENKVAKYLIPMPKGGYSPETWIAIKPLPLLNLLVGVAYFVFYGLFLCNHPWSLPLGLMVLPLFLYACCLFDFGMDAHWSHGGYKPGLFMQEIIISIAIIVPLIHLAKQVLAAMAA